MEDRDLQRDFIMRLNGLLFTLDLKKLDISCNSEDDSYAKDTLKKMHDIFIEVYKTDYLDSCTYEFVEVPAIIKGKNTGHIGLGIVSLDIQSFGEHWGTFFLTPKGVIEQGSEKLFAYEREYVNQTYIPYDYWYTVSLERDYHVDFDNVPEKIGDMLNACHTDQLGMKME
ncbi:hypothetical protein KQI41_10745 [Tissierella pigra]|uniref:Uncharacterized protein n=1 Tax=Tissierella pigra TaxID=2607614 RepID=A0A6N7Y165_9FIRM|nr:hypothetical protein [Tissierella pigra]MBU5426888.1 hypothetical protein [Tissierella pigra]MSU03483.1 hypothetical protein [Tissierella pigra]